MASTSTSTRTLQTTQIAWEDVRTLVLRTLELGSTLAATRSFSQLAELYADAGAALKATEWSGEDDVIARTLDKAARKASGSPTDELRAARYAAAFRAILGWDAVLSVLSPALDETRRLINDRQWGPAADLARSVVSAILSDRKARGVAIAKRLLGEGLRAAEAREAGGGGEEEVAKTLFYYLANVHNYAHFRMCPLCRGHVRSPFLLPRCGHSFCALCIGTTVSRALQACDQETPDAPVVAACPVCKKPIDGDVAHAVLAAHAHAVQEDYTRASGSPQEPEESVHSVVDTAPRKNKAKRKKYTLKFTRHSSVSPDMPSPSVISQTSISSQQQQPYSPGSGTGTLPTGATATAAAAAAAAAAASAASAASATTTAKAGKGLEHGLEESFVQFELDAIDTSVDLDTHDLNTHDLDHTMDARGKTDAGGDATLTFDPVDGGGGDTVTLTYDQKSGGGSEYSGPTPMQDAGGQDGVFSYTIDSQQLDVIEYELLEPIENGLGGRVGAGAFGDVYHMMLAGSDVAVKMFTHVRTPKDVTAFLREASVLRDVRHPRCLTVMGVIVGGGQLGIVTEFMEGGNLRDWLHCVGGSGPRQDMIGPGIRLLEDVGQALGYLHVVRDLCHRDVKPNNILLDASRTRAKLGDFGLSCSPDAQTGGFTEKYAAPEILQALRSAGPPADVYAFAIVVVQTLTGLEPFTWLDANPDEMLLPPSPGCCIRRLATDVYRKPYTPTEWDTVKSMLEALLPSHADHAVSLIFRSFANDPLVRPSMASDWLPFLRKIRVQSSE